MKKEGLFNLKAEIEMLRNEKSRSVPELADRGWILVLAVWLDITSLLNELNTKLQEKGKLFYDVFSDITAFKMKLKFVSKLLKGKSFAILLHIQVFFKYLEKNGLSDQMKMFQKLPSCLKMNYNQD
jgi:hypothetical protein